MLNESWCVTSVSFPWVGYSEVCSTVSEIPSGMNSVFSQPGFAAFPPLQHPFSYWCFSGSLPNKWLTLKSLCQNLLGESKLRQWLLSEGKRTTNKYVCGMGSTADNKSVHPNWVTRFHHEWCCWSLWSVYKGSHGRASSFEHWTGPGYHLMSAIK